MFGRHDKTVTTGVEEVDHALPLVRKPSLMMGILYLIVATLGISAMTALGPVVYVAASLLEGWVISVLWRWFIVTTFGLPAMSVVAAIGVVIFFRSVITPQPAVRCEHKQEAKSWFQISCSVIRPLLFLAFGAIWHCFM